MATNKSFKFITPLLAMVALVGLGALGAYVKHEHDAPTKPEIAAPNNTEEGAPTKAAPEKVAKKATDDTSDEKVEVFKPEQSGDDVVFKPESRTVKEGVEPMAFSVNESIHQLNNVPAEGKVLKVELKGGQAILQCTSALQAGYSSDEEAALLNCVKQTLGQFKQIESFSFEIDGKPVTSFGQFDLSQPITVHGPLPAAKPQ